MDLETVIKTRRSVRAFDKREIPDEVLQRILEAARMAPSANNLQPWRFIVVRNAATRTKMVKLAHEQAWVAQAPVVIVCCGKKYMNPANWIGDSLYLVDVAIAIDHLVLSARNEGVGACWLAAFDHLPLKKLVGVPNDHDIVMLIPMGYPAKDGAFYASTERLPLKEIVFAEKFGKRLLE